MSKQRKNILLAYVVHLSLLAIFFVIIISYVIHENTSPAMRMSFAV